MQGNTDMSAQMMFHDTHIHQKTAMTKTSSTKKVKIINVIKILRTMFKIVASPNGK